MLPGVRLLIRRPGAQTMECSTLVTASPETPHTYRFGILTRALAGLAATTYGAAGLFVAVKAFSENPPIGFMAALVTVPTAALLLYFFLYPRLDISPNSIVARLPFGTRTLLVSNIGSVALTYSKNGRVVNLVPRDCPGKPLRIHPYFATDQFFRDWLGKFPTST